METTHAETAFSAALSRVPSALGIGMSSSSKSLEVRADGIYDTSNNRPESKQLHDGGAAPKDLAPTSLNEPAEQKKRGEGQGLTSHGRSGGASSSARQPHASELDEPVASRQELRAKSAPCDIELHPSHVAALPTDLVDTVATTSKDIAAESLSDIQVRSARLASPREVQRSSPRVDVPSIKLNSRNASPRDLGVSSSRDKSTYSNKVVTDDTLDDIQAFLASKIYENQLSSHAQQIHEFLAQHLSPSQQQQHMPALIQRLVEQFVTEAAAQGDVDVSIDIQSSVCLLEQLFLPVGRLSPLQHMYTPEEEALLESLALHSSRCTNDA